MPKDDFSKASQKTARSVGEYDRVAKEIENKKCVFCDLKEKYIIKKNRYCVLTVNIFPYIDGQLLVVPKRHVETWDKLNDKEEKSMTKLAKLGIELLRKELDINNIWWIIRDGESAGKTVKHLHGNIMPYTDKLNTWNYQKITIEPFKLAQLLKNSTKR